MKARNIWFAVRLATGDAVLLVSVVFAGLYGVVLLLFGLPPKGPTPGEVVDAIACALPILVMVWAILFVCNLGRGE